MKGITFFLLLVSISVLNSQPVTLRDTTNQYDYIIITVPEFVNTCEPFKQHKETVRDFKTLIVDTTQIYAEFDSSATPQDNIRDFISYAGTFWEEPLPMFFLIVGTVSDVPNFQIYLNPDYSYSDHYYSQNTYENNPTTTDFYIGRVPASNETEIQNYLSKVIEYESNNTLNSWLNNNLFLCQDEPTFGFLEGAFYLANNFPPYIRSYFIVDSDTSFYYGNKDSIYKAINERGCAVLWFQGFGSDSSFISNYFNIYDLTELNNQPMYFISIYLSTQHSILDSNTNMTNEMMKMSDAGSLGGIVHVGLSFLGIQNVMRPKYAQRLFSPLIQSIGEAFTLDGLIPFGGLYGYMLKTTNLWADPSLKLKYDTTVGVEQVAIETPQSIILDQNYPNPFNPTTTIKFALPVNSKVKINIYNSLGQLVETLVDKEMESGYHEVNFDASRLASGIYLYQLKAGNFFSTKKMILLK